MEHSLFENLGGQATVNATVDLFYDKVLTDDRLKDFFANMDMKRQRAHQKAFLTYAFGGAPYYDGKSLRRAHARMVAEKGLSDMHFDAMLENLKAAMQELEINPDYIEQALDLLGNARGDVLNL